MRATQESDAKGSGDEFELGKAAAEKKQKHEN